MMLSDEEREVRIAAFAPENGFVLHPAGPPLIFHCDKQVNTELRKSDFKQLHEELQLFGSKREKKSTQHINVSNLALSISGRGACTLERCSKSA
jgi:hypothetical protein